MTGAALRLRRFERTVTDLAAATRYYCEALGFTIDIAEDDSDLANFYGRDMQTTRLRLGHQSLWLTAFDPRGAIYPGGTAADLWFQHFALVARDMQAAYTHVSLHPGTTISRHGPVTLPPSTGSVTAYKFRDPEGHPLELIHFPSGPWQNENFTGPVIGIDHSAISIADAERSIAFYRDRLGFTVAAQGLNSGSEQKSLDDLAADRVSVIALQPQAQATPHLELLAYHHPQGRSGPALSPWDSAADRIVMDVDDMDAVLSRLGDWPYQRAELRNGLQGVLLHDPDGHFLVLLG